MLLPLLLAVAPAGDQALADATATFAAMARVDEGRALKAFAAPDALLLTPEPTPLAEFKPARPRPMAMTTSYFACDADMAVTQGPGAAMVWGKQPNGRWRWRIADLAGGTSFAATAPPMRAACAGVPPQPQPPARAADGGTTGADTAIDGTLHYQWHVAADRSATFGAAIWTDGGWREVVSRRHPAPPARPNGAGQ